MWRLWASDWGELAVESYEDALTELAVASANIYALIDFKFVSEDTSDGHHRLEPREERIYIARNPHLFSLATPLL